MRLKPLHEILLEAFPKLGDVRQGFVEARDALLKLKDSAPDAEGFIDARVAELNAKIAVLDDAVENADLGRLALVGVQELAAIPSVGLTGKFKPGSVTGG